MFVKSTFIVLATLLGSLSATNTAIDPIVLKPANSTSGPDISVVWIQGALCKPEAYQKIAQAFIDESASNNVSAWVSFPDFDLNTPEPIEMPNKLKQARSALLNAGYNGTENFIAAHSLGTVMVQDEIKKDPQDYKGLFLMGGSLLRKMHHNDNSTGLTNFDFPIPSMTLAGTKDGMYRISRNAESHHHQVLNIVPSQKDMFPVALLKGVSHARFMDETMIPSLVRKDDLAPDVT